MSLVITITRNTTLSNVYSEQVAEYFPVESVGPLFLKPAVVIMWSSSHTCVSSVLMSEYALKAFYPEIINRLETTKKKKLFVLL